MKKQLVIGILALALAAPAALVADNHEEAEQTFIYGTYFYCDTATQGKADELVKNVMAPIYDAAVADGTIKGWGWLAHHTGGKWRRIQYHTSSTLEGLFAAQDIIGERADKAMEGKEDAINQSCNAHDDYVWQRKGGNAVESARGTVALSVYHVCSMADEDRIDELFNKVSAPVLDKAVADGKLMSWGWNSHVLGGAYRRLETMSAKDLPTLMKARTEIIASIYADGGSADAAEFDKLCTSHADYVWDIVHEGR